MPPFSHWLRRLRGELVAALAVAGLVFITALAVAVAPRLLEQRSDRALRTELAAASSFDRNTVIYEFSRSYSRPLEDFADMTDEAAELQTAFPPDVQDLIVARTSLVETPLWQVRETADLQSVLRIRAQDGLFDHLRLTSGRLPTDITTITDDDRPGARPEQYSFVYEALLPASAATDMGIELGDRLPLAAWFSDQLNIGVNLGAVLTIVGTYVPADPAADYWLVIDNTVTGWRLHTVGTNDFLETTAIVAPGVYPTLTRSARDEGMTLLYQYRFFVDTGRLAAEDVPAAISALRRVEGAVPRTGISNIPTDTRMTSGLLRLLEGHQATWRAAQTILAFLGLGVLAIAICTLTVVAMVASGGRRRVASLFRARGASGLQVMLPAAVEVGLICLPAALVGLAIALLTVPAAATVPAIFLVAAVATLAMLIMLVVVARVGAATRGEEAGRMRIAGRLSARRVVTETSLALAALGGAWLLRERGINAAANASETGGADPVIAAVLALVGLAAGVIAMRVYPLPARLVGWLVGYRRDLLPVLAVRRAIRGGSSAAVLLLLVATATVGAFSSATLVHLERGAQLAAWQEIGADFRITSTTQTLPNTLDESQLPGVQAAARGSLRSVETSRGTAYLMTFEPTRLAEVVRGTPAELALPAGMLADAATQPLPTMAGGLSVRPGDTLEATVNGVVVRLRVEGTSPGFPGVPVGQPYVAVATAHLGSVLPGGAPRPSTSFLRAAPDAAGALRAAVAGVASWLTVDSRAELEARTLSAPVMEALRGLIAAATALALAYAALAVGAALLLAGAAQRDEIAHLRALGMSRRGHAWLSALEYGPAALIGYLIGVGLGLALFSFVLPALGLTAIIGARADLPVAVEPIHLVALLGAMLAILTVGWLVGVLAQRDTNPATAIRRGVE